MKNKTLLRSKCPSTFLSSVSRTHGNWVKGGHLCTLILGHSFDPFTVTMFGVWNNSEMVGQNVGEHTHQDTLK